MARQRVGVIGGGQLAWMMALEAKTVGLDVIVQTPKLTDPAVSVAAASILAPVADAVGTKSLATRCQIVTFENEFVDLTALKPLEEQGVSFQPQLQALAPLLDKYTQRQFLDSYNLPNPPYVALDETTPPEDMAAMAAAVGFPLVMKTRRLGYDGQGTFMIASAEALQETWLRIKQQPVLLEAFIPFEKELAVMVARSTTGEVTIYPVVETQQVDQVCRRVIAPAAVSQTVETTVKAIAKRLIEQLDFVGVLGIELFLAPNETVLVNEVAPRTHNSGHYTLDACITSQFAQQLRAVTGQSLGSTEMTCDRAVMVNLLGFEHAERDYAEQRQHLAQILNAHVHWYGKCESRPGRKLGHVTVCLDPGQSAVEIAEAIETLWYPSDDS
ncbi:MAG: 5-(carboxyamino)imidazole ribonucleotide synthase [Leptolyngbya sp. SIO1D8]|nr:5-(carboxyamino)imidazole ribonucleotide synthase [Leptolyngbya sp. SIO1D8]